jgi:hypothetical protein
MSDPYEDPYAADFYSTPIKKTGDTGNNTTKIFKPTNNPVINNNIKTHTDEELPNFVDLTRNAYANTNGGSADTDEEIPILEGIIFNN